MSFSNSWYSQSAPHYIDAAIIENNELLDDVLSNITLNPDEGDERRTDNVRHEMNTSLSLRELYERLLTKFRVCEPEDSKRYTGVLLQISNYLQGNPDATCTLISMSSGGIRTRSVNQEDKIPTVFQGPAPSTPGRVGSIYPGDRAIKSGDQLSIQLHRLQIQKDGAITHSNVPLLAIWVPEAFEKSWVSQYQN